MLVKRCNSMVRRGKGGPPRADAGAGLLKNGLRYAAVRGAGGVPKNAYAKPSLEAPGLARAAP